jgi:hypothetical protein
VILAGKKLPKRKKIKKLNKKKLNIKRKNKKNNKITKKYN